MASLPNYIGLILGIISLITVIFMWGRWAQKVESPISIEKLSWHIDALTKAFSELREVFDRRYTGLEGRYNTDHTLLREVVKDKAISDMRIADLRRDVDEVLKRNT